MPSGINTVNNVITVTSQSTPVAISTTEQSVNVTASDTAITLSVIETPITMTTTDTIVNVAVTETPIIVTASSGGSGTITSVTGSLPISVTAGSDPVVSINSSFAPTGNSVPLRNNNGDLGSQDFTGRVGIINTTLAASTSLDQATGEVRAASSVIAQEGNLYASDNSSAYPTITGGGNVVAVNQIITNSTAVDSIKTSGGIQASDLIQTTGDFVAGSGAEISLESGVQTRIANLVVGPTNISNNAIFSTVPLTANRTFSFPNETGLLVVIDYATGANTSIKSITGLTTPLSVAQGGTGSSTAATGTGGVVLATSPTITAPFGIQATTGNVTATGVIPSASVSARIMTANSATPITLTMPTPATMATILTGLVNQSIDWTVINIGAGAVTFAINGLHTIVGSLALAAGASASFRSRKTVVSPATFVSYRIA